MAPMLQAMSANNNNRQQLCAASASAPSIDYSCEFGSGKYFALCGIGGILSCGITHTMVTPLDLVKCRLQGSMELGRTCL